MQQENIANIQEQIRALMNQVQSNQIDLNQKVNDQVAQLEKQVSNQTERAKELILFKENATILFDKLNEQLESMLKEMEDRDAERGMQPITEQFKFKPIVEQFMTLVTQHVDTVGNVVLDHGSQEVLKKAKEVLAILDEERRTCAMWKQRVEEETKQKEAAIKREE
jgi:hypothetical protein